MRGIEKEIRCGNCGRLLAKGTAIALEIKCPRCGEIKYVTAEIATMQTKKDSGPDTRIIVGPYRIPLSRERFLLLERDLMTTAGFTKAEIHAEILRRLGVCAE